MNEKPLAILRGISKRYDSGTLAVRGVDLTVDDGDFIALLGPSGCGKSTLLRIVAGLSDPTAGDIDWPSNTHDVHGRPEHEISFVFQDPTLMPWSTALGNVTLPLELAGVNRSEARDRGADALRRVELNGFEKAFPRALSGGMRMRVSIARALVTRPRLLLMDEPFAALDEITRFRLNNDLLDLWQEENFTVIFVTHSVFESVYLARRVVIMAPRPGRVTADITVGAAYPRGEEFRTSSDYAGHCREVSQSLSRAMVS